MLKTAEPGMSFNFGIHSEETVRNACAEYISDKDSAVCNLGSVNFGAIETIEELAEVSYLASKFLVCGGVKADLPTEKIKKVREEDRDIGMGLMGLHEWLLKRRLPYEVNPVLDAWLSTWKYAGYDGANEISGRLGIKVPKRYRAIAPTGTIGIVASTTTGIEPLYAVAYERRHLIGKSHWESEIVIDATADRLIKEYDLDPEEIETSSTLAQDPERRIKFQYDVQRHVDMGISSTLNLPEYSKQSFSPDEFGALVLKYAPGLRGLTVYPDGARGGQPLTAVSYRDAVKKRSKTLEIEPECDK